MRAVVLYEYGDEFTIPIARVFRLEEVRQAQDLAENQHPSGKVLLVA